MKRRAVLPLCLVFLLGTASAGNLERVVTRYGEVEVVNTDGAEQYEVVWGKRQILSAEAMWIFLYRVSPQGTNEYVVIDARVAGLNCLHEFRILGLMSDDRYFLSEKFGECTELKGVQHKSDGVIVETEGSVRGEKHRYAVSEGGVIESK